MKRIARIDRDKCIGCGLCAAACQEGAMGMFEGKAKVLREDYCDGFGNCLPVCPAGAISFTDAGPSGGRHWPLQIKLVPASAPFFTGADLLIAADCTAFACKNFHTELAEGRVVVIGCPKLDGADYSEKLTDILSRNDIKSVTVARMEVPCCNGIERAAGAALENSGKNLPFRSVTISREGQLL